MFLMSELQGQEQGHGLISLLDTLYSTHKSVLKKTTNERDTHVW